MIVIVLALVVVAVAVAVYRFSLTFEPRQRVVFWIVVALVAAYFLPSLIDRGLAGYRAGAEIRQQQRR